MRPILDLLFEESSFDVLVPQGQAAANDADAIVGSPQRPFVFFGETVDLFLKVSLPRSEKSVDPAALRDFFANVAVQAESSLEHGSHALSAALSPIDNPSSLFSNATPAKITLGGGGGLPAATTTSSSSTSSSNAPATIALHVPARVGSGAPHVAAASAVTGTALVPASDVNRLSKIGRQDSALLVEVGRKQAAAGQQRSRRPTSQPDSGSGSGSGSVSSGGDQAQQGMQANQPMSSNASDPSSMNVASTVDTRLRSDQPIVSIEGLFALYPLQISVGYSGGSKSNSSLVVDVIATLRAAASNSATEDLAVSEYNSFNYLPGLIDDQTFNKYRQKGSMQENAFKRNIRRAILVKHAMFVRMHTTPISHDRILVSMEIESNRETNAVLRIQNLFLSIATAASTDMKSSKSRADIDEYFKIQPESLSFPIMLNPLEEFCTLFTVSLVADSIPYEFFTEKGKYRIVLNINWTPTPEPNSSSIFSSFFKTLDIQKLFQEKKVEDISVSFTVSSDVSVRKIFAVQVFVVNRSPEMKDISIIVPHDDREASIGALSSKAAVDRSESHPIASISLPATDFLSKYADNERQEASLVCLESNVELGILQPNTCKSAILHFVPVKEGLHFIRRIQLVDHESDTEMNLKDVLKVYVKPYSESKKSFDFPQEISLRDPPM